MRKSSRPVGRPPMENPEDRKAYTRTDAQQRAQHRAAVPKAVRVDLAGRDDEEAMLARYEASCASARPSRTGPPRVCRSSPD